MKIYSPSGVELLDIEPDEQSYRSRSIMEIGSVVLYYSLPQHLELPIGAYIDFGSTRYTLRLPEAFVMHHSENYEYTVTFMAPEYGATIWMFTNPIDHRLTFDLTATPREHLQMWVDNMNMRDSGWVLGECVDGTEKVITYDYTYCWDALRTMADTFHTEIEISGKVVSLKMVEYHKSNPIPLCYGKGNGFKSGVGRNNEDNVPPVDRLYVQGGETNIDYSKYGTSIREIGEIEQGSGELVIPTDPNLAQGNDFVHSNRLLLPRSVQYAFDGEKFEDEDGFNSSAARHYATDQYGYYVERTDSGRNTDTEQAYDATAHYPKRVGVVSSVISHAVEDGVEYYIRDNTIPYALDLNECWIEGGKMTVIFQTGMLAGREFDVAEDGYKHFENGAIGGLFRLVSQEYDGMIMPNAEGGFLPAVGDEYIVVGCMLPQAYISDEATKTGAEWDMLRAAIRYRFPREEYLYTFSGDIDEVWLHREWSRLGARFALGEYARFRDSRIGTDMLLRMTAIKDYINRPWRIELTLSNAPMQVDFSDRMRRVSSNAIRAGRPRLRQVPIPQGIQTRFRFITGQNDYTEVVPSITYSGENVYDEDAQMMEWVESLTVQGGLLQHKAMLTDARLMRLIGGSTTTDNDLYLINSGNEQEIPIGAHSENETLYLYAKVKTDHTGGTYSVQSEKKPYRDGAWLWLYMGELSPVQDRQRIFTRHWRWLEIASNTITLTATVGGVDIDVSELLNNFDTDISDNSAAIAGHTTKIATITGVLNSAVARANDLTTLLTTRLTDALNNFNAAQSAEGGNTIDVDFCIDDGTGRQGEEHCKTFPDISQITNI